MRNATRVYSVKDPNLRFWPKVEVTEGCWFWVGGRDIHGYGKFSTYNGRGKGHTTVGAHRWSYESLVGPIEEGLTLDHLCRVRNCVNPDHLESVPMGVNVLRGGNACAENARKTHCIRGHLLDEANTYHPPKEPNKRKCRTCAKEQKEANSLAITSKR